ncbi:transcription factor FapR [uncultured Megasphaera sp.]|uniref:transcription factor FapR n=1 Tax=uncultured Megasphaera sp. TaxID=165188 RepID=UPI0026592D06|nr:transcription factor FapR [uncultured Megasphaera sp.]
MVRIARDKRHVLLQQRIEQNPFVNDEELAEEFSVSVATIRLDRMALGIPEMRIRIKKKAEAAQPKTKQDGFVGELVECSVGHRAISIMTATEDMVDEAHIVRSQCLYAQAHSLARAVLHLPVSITAVANLKYKQPVTVGDKLIAVAEVIRCRAPKYYVWVKIRKNAKEVFRTKFIIESLE